MDTEATAITVYEASLQAYARKLIGQRAGFMANELNWVLHEKYLALPLETRRSLSYHEYVIRELGE